MNRRYFWSIPEFTKYRTVFENAKTVLGVSEDNQFTLFRKEKVSFEESDALRNCIATIFVTESPDVLAHKTEAMAV